MNSPFAHKGFTGFFWTQFLGAFNDNLFKQSIVFLAQFQLAATLPKAQADFYVSLGAGLFILPFVLFSSWGATWANRAGKTKVIRATKLLEIGIMVLSLPALLLLNPQHPEPGLWALLGVLFLMGTQSALFGPSKYGILPEILPVSHLSGANAFLEMGTFVAILLGSYAGGWLVEWRGAVPLSMAPFYILVALIGFWACFRVPPTQAQKPQERFDPTLVGGLWKNFRQSAPAIRQAIWASSLFWFAGAVILQVLPGLGSLVGASSIQSNLFMAVFSLGIGLGTLSAGQLSQNKVERGLSPWGAAGVCLFAAGFWVFRPGAVTNWSDLLGIYGAALGLGFAGGIFVVPINTFLQYGSSDSARAGVMACNNFLNALFMVLATGFTLLLRNGLGLEEPQLLLILGGMFLVIFGLLTARSAVYWQRAGLLWRFRGTSLQGQGVLLGHQPHCLLLEEETPETLALLRYASHHEFHSLGHPQPGPDSWPFTTKNEQAQAQPLPVLRLRLVRKGSEIQVQCPSIEY